MNTFPYNPADPFHPFVPEHLIEHIAKQTKAYIENSFINRISVNDNIKLYKED